MEIKERIIQINTNYGGKLVREGSLDFACDKITTERNIYRKCAYLVRAIVVDHPFSDYNKSTASAIVIEEMYKEGIACDEKILSKTMVKIAQENLIDIHKIEMRLRKCCHKK